MWHGSWRTKREISASGRYTGKVIWSANPARQQPAVKGNKQCVYCIYIYIYELQKRTIEGETTRRVRIPSIQILSDLFIMSMVRK